MHASKVSSVSLANNFKHLSILTQLSQQTLVDITAAFKDAFMALSKFYLMKIIRVFKGIFITLLIVLENIDIFNNSKNL